MILHVVGCADKNANAPIPHVVECRREHRQYRCFRDPNNAFKLISWTILHEDRSWSSSEITWNVDPPWLWYILLWKTSRLPHGGRHPDFALMGIRAYRNLVHSFCIFTMKLIVVEKWKMLFEMVDVFQPNFSQANAHFWRIFWELMLRTFFPTSSIKGLAPHT